MQNLLENLNRKYNDKKINNKYLVNLEKRVCYLSFYPLIYQVKFESDGHEIRVARFMKYLLCYEFISNMNIVMIYGIFYKSEDYQNKIIYKIPIYE